MTRWPEIRIPDDYRAIFEPASGVLRSELAVESWIRLAREAARTALQLPGLGHSPPRRTA
jgi:N-methyl-L-tryptophan oxidase